MILLLSSVLLKVDTTLNMGKILGTLITHIISVAHSHKSLFNGLDCKLMTLSPYNQNTTLKWKKKLVTEPE